MSDHTDTIDITYTPERVRVSRPAGDELVDGHRVVVAFPDGRTVTGTRIDPDGTSRDCWLTGGLELLPVDVVEAVRDFDTYVEVEQ